MAAELKLWQKELLRAFGERVRPYGFAKRKGQSFDRICALARKTFHLSFIEHGTDFDITADVAIRFDDLEKMVNPHSRETHTIGVELGNLSEGRQKRWTIASPDGILGVADSLLDAFVHIGLPYFDEYSDPKRALEILSGDNPNSWLHAPLHAERARLAVGMALHMNGKEAGQQVAKRKLLFLEEANDPGLASFRAFLDKIGLGGETKVAGNVPFGER